MCVKEGPIIWHYQTRGSIGHISGQNDLEVADSTMTRVSTSVVTVRGIREGEVILGTLNSIGDPSVVREGYNSSLCNGRQEAITERIDVNKGAMGEVLDGNEALEDPSPTRRSPAKILSNVIQMQMDMNDDFDQNLEVDDEEIRNKICAI
ncbi:hypothetical protein U1Q18_019424 [Sarracenia purpurea var. burkii]